MSDNHGNTPAAWTGVSIAMLGFLVAGIALMLNVIPVFIVGLVLIPLGGIVGFVMSRGAKARTSH